MSCYCDGDPADIWDEKKRKARKEHKCAECGDQIKKGEEYMDISCLSDGSWDHFRLCEYCEHDWDIVKEAGHCQVIGWLEETWDELYRYAGPPKKFQLSVHGAWERTNG